MDATARSLIEETNAEANVLAIADGIAWPIVKTLNIFLDIAEGLALSDMADEISTLIEDAEEARMCEKNSGDLLRSVSSGVCQLIGHTLQAILDNRLLLDVVDQFTAEVNLLNRTDRIAQPIVHLIALLGKVSKLAAVDQTMSNDIDRLLKEADRAQKRFGNDPLRHLIVQFCKCTAHTVSALITTRAYKVKQEALEVAAPEEPNVSPSANITIPSPDRTADNATSSPNEAVPTPSAPVEASLTDLHTPSLIGNRDPKPEPIDTAMDTIENTIVNDSSDVSGQTSRAPTPPSAGECASNDEMNTATSSQTTLTTNEAHQVQSPKIKERTLADAFSLLENDFKEDVYMDLQLDCKPMDTEEDFLLHFKEEEPTEQTVPVHENQSTNLAIEAMEQEEIAERVVTDAVVNEPADANTHLEQTGNDLVMAAKEEKKTANNTTTIVGEGPVVADVARVRPAKRRLLRSNVDKDPVETKRARLMRAVKRIREKSIFKKTTGGFRCTNVKCRKVFSSKHALISHAYIHTQEVVTCVCKLVVKKSNYEAHKALRCIMREAAPSGPAAKPVVVPTVPSRRSNVIAAGPPKTPNAERSGPARKDTVTPAAPVKKATFICGFCERDCKTAYALEYHESTHTGKKPYQCSDCETFFPTISARAHHVRSVHGGKPYECTCGSVFGYSSKLRMHLEEVAKQTGHEEIIPEFFV